MFIDMKSINVLCCVILLIHYNLADAKPMHGAARCVNMWDEGCINGQLPGAGGDDDYLNGGFNPGKRCLNVWDEGCNNGPLPAPPVVVSGDDGGRAHPGREFLYELLARLQKKHQVY